MVTLTIDDKQVTVPKDATIFDAAKQAGIRIPILCHDKKLHPFGGCRMCLVEVEQMKGRQIPACTTPVTEGMIVRTMTDEIVKARKMVLELLLLKHPIDCPVCDAAGDCDLQNLTYEYGVDTNRFTDEKFNWKIDYVNPLIERDMNRCVHCGKCARICDEIVSFGAYSFINRGIEAKIGTEFDGPLNCEFCGSCVSVCPVGALISRPFKFKARWWALNKVKTVCSYCGTGCQLTLGVKDNKVLTTIYDENQGFHNGQLCTRGRWGYQFVNSSKRLTTPLIRKGDTLQPASWDEALGMVADRLKTSKDAAATLVTPRLTNEELYLLKRVVKDAVGSDNLDHSGGYAHEALTAGARESLGFPGSPSVIADIQKSELLLVIKTDAYETHPVIGFEVNLAVKRQGVALRILSDKKGKLSRLPGAQTYVHTPGAELVLVNALAKTIVDEGLHDASSVGAIKGFDAWLKSIESCTPDQAAGQCGIAADTIKAVAREYAAAGKALIMLPLGMGYPGHGKALAQALINLALLTGRVGKEGCGVLIMGEKNNSQGAADLGIHPTANGLNAQAILAGCSAGSIKTLYVVGENPVVSYPNRKQVEAALDAVEFLVVQDLFLTETASKADVVLPACSFAEKDGTFTSLGGAVQRVNRAITPLGDCRSDFDILNMLHAKLTGQAAYTSQKEAFADLAAATPGYAGLTLEGLGDAGAVRVNNCTASFVPVATSTVTTEAGKFALLTGSALNHSGTLSLYGEGPMLVCPEGYLELNKDDAAKLSITEGDAVTMKSATGELRLKAKVGTRLPQGVAFAPYHFAEASINSLTGATAITWITISK
ncbi:molybdopterin-dependent oxidoreductase [Geobacter sulfurreducens]|uniref:NADPH-Fe(3+) oxidoreductase subunit alpha n=1 Tax=Geobacter sulfurreducens (strain ATCC 51573 / DSM 12127 / PCA) TaxID=243231 RepID=Q74GA2_GEOSL|nr:molybdopterin-dependent oxidoreductase [Geobacter sulfurreducens]AAR33677.1 NADH dehydrogenase I, G subunit [Geobacter sulfurreducens PCA]ADI83175.1 NADH dehydrogenase I, G subunit [Geobacter sulfurreducens KN400]AJY70069.1 NADH dehydrogenase [Geobacter sulfurreducens]QVW35604.1 molybdopterin-dependent oxidoreductase [Geobacter sulfurreducens]UAC04427.1 molybdopterin-dependent oxidoreductase [Geobacter sulfurreducens]